MKCYQHASGPHMQPGQNSALPYSIVASEYGWTREVSSCSAPASTALRGLKNLSCPFWLQELVSVYIHGPFGVYLFSLLCLQRGVTHLSEYREKSRKKGASWGIWGLHQNVCSQHTLIPWFDFKHPHSWTRVKSSSTSWRPQKLVYAITSWLTALSLIAHQI